MKVLDRSWINCLRMWKWVSENLPDGFLESTEGMKDFVIDILKQNWLKKNKFTKEIAQDCFFCDYDNKYKGDCENCPAVLAHPERPFHCTDDKYNYAYEPINFYEELMNRNARRKGD